MHCNLKFNVMKNSNFTILRILSWILFIALLVEAGGFVFNILYTLFINTGEARYFWENVDLSALYKFDPVYFIVETSLMTSAAVLKALIFYFIVKLFEDKKYNLEQPFNHYVRRFISRTAFLALGIGAVSHLAANHAKWFVKKGVQMPDTQDLTIDGADVWIFMGIILLVIAQVFKRGIELQTENELTV